jgi:hypothetical protein
MCALVSRMPGHAQRGVRPRHGTAVAHEAIYAGNWVRCMRLPILVLVSK